MWRFPQVRGAPPVKYRARQSREKLPNTRGRGHIHICKVPGVQLKGVKKPRKVEKGKVKRGDRAARGAGGPDRRGRRAGGTGSASDPSG
eukprot:gene23028-biopygen13340